MYQYGFTQVEPGWTSAALLSNPPRTPTYTRWPPHQPHLRALDWGVPRRPQFVTGRALQLPPRAPQAFDLARLPTAPRSRLVYGTGVAARTLTHAHCAPPRYTLQKRVFLYGPRLLTSATTAQLPTLRRRHAAMPATPHLPHHTRRTHGCSLFGCLPGRTRPPAAPLAQAEGRATTNCIFFTALPAIHYYWRCHAAWFFLLFLGCARKRAGLPHCDNARRIALPAYPLAHGVGP